MKQPQLTTNHSQPVQPAVNLNQQHQYYGYNQNGFQGNLYNRVNPQYPNGYSHGQYPYQQPYVNQFAHNPYIGYTPHNQLHASYNMNFTLN